MRWIIFAAMLLLPTAAQATTYPIFASGPDVHTGKIESLWATSAAH
jgi:hypothetical protein